MAGEAEIVPGPDGQEVTFEAAPAEQDAGLFRAEIPAGVVDELAMGDIALASLGTPGRDFVELRHDDIGGWIILSRTMQRGAIVMGGAPGVVTLR